MAELQLELTLHRGPTSSVFGHVLKQEMGHFSRYHLFALPLIPHWLLGGLMAFYSQHLQDQLDNMDFGYFVLWLFMIKN